MSFVPNLSLFPQYICKFKFAINIKGETAIQIEIKHAMQDHGGELKLSNTYFTAVVVTHSVEQRD